MADREDLVALVFDGPPTPDGEPGPRLLRVEDADGNALEAFGAWGRDEKHQGCWMYIFSASEIHTVYKTEGNGIEATKAEFDHMMKPEEVDRRATEGLVNGFYALANAAAWEPSDYMVNMRAMLEERITEIATDRHVLETKRKKLKAVIPVTVDPTKENPFDAAYERAVESLDGQLMQMDIWLSVMQRSLELLDGFKDQPPMVQH